MKERWLGYYLLIFGVLNIFVVSFTVPLLFGDRLLWHPRNVPDEMMLSVIYLAMGIVMVAVAKRPLTHKAFIDFLILGNLLHAVVMLACAEHILHIVFDVTTVGVMGLLPLLLYPWRVTSFLRYVEV